MFNFHQNIRIGDRMIGPDYPTYIIAEIGGNFDGSLEKAKRLIDAAKAAGADCAKFQTFKAESIVSEGGFSKMQLHGVHGSWGRTVSEVFKDVELPLEWHQELADYCAKVGIDFSTSPYNKEAVDLCAKMKLPFIKIGSGEITWLEMLDYIARKGMPVMLATGDATMSEIDEAVRTIEKTGNKDFVLNAMKYLTDDEGLMALRARDFKLRLLDRKRIAASRLRWQLLNMLLPPALLLLGGGIWLWIRHRRYAR